MIPPRPRWAYAAAASGPSREAILSWYSFRADVSWAMRSAEGVVPGVTERASDIINHLNRLREELAKFDEDFRKVGMHLTNAQTRFVEAEKRLARFEEKLTSASEHPAPPAVEAKTPAQLPFGDAS